MHEHIYKNCVWGAVGRTDRGYDKKKTLAIDKPTIRFYGLIMESNMERLVECGGLL